MNTWFESTAKYTKIDETGQEKKVSETYLLDAISFTEAENRIYDELKSMIRGEFVIAKITRTKISEIIPSDNGDRWYKARVAFITVDEENGKEKKVIQNLLVFSDNIKNAFDQIINAMQGMMADFEIIGISESTILEVFPYKESDLTENLKPFNLAGELPENDENP